MFRYTTIQRSWLLFPAGLIIILAGILLLRRKQSYAHALIAGFGVLAALFGLIFYLPEGIEAAVCKGIGVTFSFLFAARSFIVAKSTYRLEGFGSTFLQSFLLGTVLLICGVFLLFHLPQPNLIQKLSLGFIAYFLWMLSGCSVCAAICPKKLPDPPPDILLILGCAIKNHSISKELKRRLDYAVQITADTKQPVSFLLCGGDTAKNGFTEASKMREYLLQLGIEENRIILEDTSSTTVENFKNAADILKRYPSKQIAFLTSEYHVFRSSLCARSAGIPLHGIGCPTPLLRVPASYIREAIAWTSKLKLLLCIYTLFLLIICLIP